jgi:DNA-binding NarL/FixJ family response regulator
MFERALIVDNDRSAVALLRSILTQAGVSNIRWESSLEGGLEALGFEPQLLFCEVVFGSDCVFRLLERIRTLKVVVHVLAMSATALRSQVFALHEYGVTCFWEKPVTGSQVARAIDKLWRKRERAQSGVRRCASERLPSLGAGYHLTPAESRILAYAELRMSYAEMAAEHCVSRNTIKSQVRAVLGKLGARNLQELAMILRQGEPMLPAKAPTLPLAKARRPPG